MMMMIMVMIMIMIMIIIIIIMTIIIIMIIIIMTTTTTTTTEHLRCNRVLLLFISRILASFSFFNLRSLGNNPPCGIKLAVG